MEDNTTKEEIVNAEKSEEKQEQPKEETKKEIKETKTTEKILTLNLRKYYLGSSKFKRAKKAIKVLRMLVQRHSKAKLVKISTRLNEYIWNRGIKNPPSRVTVKITVKDDTAYADLAERK